MTESGNQKNGWQDNSCSGEFSSEDNLSDENEMVVENAHIPPLSGKPHNTLIMRQDKMVAGAGFEPTTFGL